MQVHDSKLAPSFLKQNGHSPVLICNPHLGQFPSPDSSPEDRQHPEGFHPSPPPQQPPPSPSDEPVGTAQEATPIRSSYDSAVSSQKAFPGPRDLRNCHRPNTLTGPWPTFPGADGCFVQFVYREHSFCRAPNSGGIRVPTNDSRTTRIALPRIESTCISPGGD